MLGYASLFDFWNTCFIVLFAETGVEIQNALGGAEGVLDVLNFTGGL
jgi:hypothetical protein